MKTEKIEILQTAISKYGVVMQMDMCIEECAELIQAINKIKRKATIYEKYIPIPSDKTKLSEIDAYNNLCSEIADVKIMIAQMEIMFDKERIDLCVERKINRLEKMIKL